MASPLTVIIVEKTGTLKSLQIKDFKESELFKKCGFKSENNFEKETTWKINNINISVYGKKTGKPNTENKYEFPPPIDEVLFFGNCVLVAFDVLLNKYIDLTLANWQSYYNHLFGGFENLDENKDDDEDEDEDEDDDDHITDDDDFIVPDDNFTQLEEEYYDD